MSHLNVIRAKSIAIAVIVAALSFSAVGAAGDEKRTVKLKAADLAGKEVSVPHARQATVLLFLRIDQEQTASTVAGVKKALEKLPARRAGYGVCRETLLADRSRSGIQDCRAIADSSLADQYRGPAKRRRTREVYRYVAVLPAVSGRLPCLRCGKN